MNVLFFDAVNDWIIVSVYSLQSGNVKELYSYKENHPKESSYRLINDISIALANAGVKIPDRIVASIGPGSFTGVRITVSTARNLAQVWNIPVIGIDTIEIYSAYYYSRLGTPVILLLDGKQKKVYGGYFAGNFKGSYDMRPEEIEKYFTAKELKAKIYTNSDLVPNGEKMNEEISDPFEIINRYHNEIVGADTKKNHYSLLLPNYLRASYADQPSSETMPINQSENDQETFHGFTG